eukprot:6600608-Prymnesium_polylepis.1
MSQADVRRARNAVRAEMSAASASGCRPERSSRSKPWVSSETGCKAVPWRLGWREGDALTSGFARIREPP